jgi:transposase
VDFPVPGSLASVLVSKYADHLPFYRQSEIYTREGVDLDRSMLADWVGAASYLLSPLVDQLRNHVLAASKITRGRHARSSAGSGHRQDQDGATLDLCA